MLSTAALFGKIPASVPAELFALLDIRTAELFDKIPPSVPAELFALLAYYLQLIYLIPTVYQPSCLH
jgi:hypothetical protein